MRKILVLASIFSIHAPLGAQEVDHSDDALVVTADGLAEDLPDIGVPVSIIPEREIRAAQGADVTRVLERVPGVTITRNGGVGSFTGVRVRGAEAEQLLVVIDGVPVADYASPGGGYDFGNLLPGTVGRMELLRSSNSTIWGSQAIGGVLAIESEAPQGIQGSVEYGADDTLYATAGAGLSGEIGELSLNGARYSSDGFSAAADGTEPDGFDQWQIGGRGRLHLGGGFGLFADARYTTGTLDIDGFPAPDYMLADTPEVQETREFTGRAGLDYRRDGLELRFAASHADIERDNYASPDEDAPLFTSDGESDRLDLRGKWDAGDFLDLSFGGSQEWTRYETDTDAASAEIRGAYLQVGLKGEALQGNFGVRIDDHSLFGSETSFGADAVYSLAPEWKLRASYGEGFKTPTLFQLFSDYGNRALGPEQSRSYDVGIAWRDRNAGPHFGLTLFQRDSRDLIGFVSCFGSTTGICEDRPFGTYDNIGKARARGIEAEAGVRPIEGVMLRAAYSYVEARNLTPGDANEGNDLARRPRNALTLSADWAAPLAGLELGADLRVVSGSWDDAANMVRLAAYEVLTLRAALPVTQAVELFGRVENLLDEDYQTAAGYGTPGRGFHLGARAAF